MSKRTILKAAVIGFAVIAVTAALDYHFKFDDAQALPEIREAFFNAYPSAVGTRLDNLPSISGHCGVCHWKFTGGGQRNPHGLAVHEAIKPFPNTLEGRTEGILTTTNDDSDGDGYMNLIEITSTAFDNTPTFPGLTSDNVNQITDVDIADVLPYLTPTISVDTIPPAVTVVSPNGGETYDAETFQLVTWSATDASGIAQIDIFLSDDGGVLFRPMLRGLANDGSDSLFIPNLPGPQSFVRVAALDSIGNWGWDTSDGPFIITGVPPGYVGTTLRDLDLAGSQPLGVGPFDDPDLTCVSCHGNYNFNFEPYHNWKGSMMAHAMRDPLFTACLAIAEQDAPSSGDLCLRCHTPGGWLEGHSFDTKGGMVTEKDRESVQCAFCHRAVDPDYKPGISPVEDQAILDSLAAIPLATANGQYVADPTPTRRGPFDDAVAQHPMIVSPFHQTSNICATCHDVSNPVYVAGVNPGEYLPDAFDAAHPDGDLRNMFPIERTFSEWQNSEYATTGVYAPQFAGSKPDGIVSTCQDCHMRDVVGEGCNEPTAPTRVDLPLHDMTGGNYFIPDILPNIYPAEVDAARLVEGKWRAISMLEKAAMMTLTPGNVDQYPAVTVSITNETGHKLPSGYPEGRRIWINLKAFNKDSLLVYESGAYDSDTGILTHDSDAKIYEIKPGISSTLSQIIGLEPGVSFHFVINDTIYSDNRIPPRGFTNAAYATIQSEPVAYSYADGQFWDETTYVLPYNATFVDITLYYQSTTKEYIEFLRDENVTNTAGQVLYDNWVSQGKAPPVAMVHDTVSVKAIPTAVDDVPRFKNELYAAHPNPFNPSTTIPYELAGRGKVSIQIYDVSGRLIRTLVDEVKPAGRYDAIWDGRNNAGMRISSGVYFLKMKTGRFTAVRKAVLMK